MFGIEYQRTYSLFARKFRRTCLTVGLSFFDCDRLICALTFCPTQRRLVAEHETAAAELQSMIEKLAFDKLQVEAARDEVRNYELDGSEFCISFFGQFAIVSPV